MKNLILFFILTSPVHCFSQSYNYIKKAERKINEKDYPSALKLLKKAQNADYGFCGNARVEALVSIDDLKLRIYRETNNKVEMEKLLNGIEPFMEFSELYSVERINLALTRFTKSELNERIINALKKSNKQDWIEFSNVVLLTFDNSDSLKLFLNISDFLKIVKDRNLSFNEALIQFYLDSNYYKQINS